MTAWRPGWRAFPGGPRVLVQRPVQLRRRIDVSPEQLDDMPRSWGPPEDLTIHAMTPGTTEPDLPGREAEDVAWTLYLPPGQVVSALDLLVIDGDEYEVIGRIRDWGVGCVLEAKRREG